MFLCLGYVRVFPNVKQWQRELVGVSSDLDQPTCSPEPARTEGPQVAPNPVYGWSQAGKGKNQIIRFGFGFQNISPEKSEKTDLIIKKNIVQDLTSHARNSPCLTMPTRDSKQLFLTHHPNMHISCSPQIKI